MRSHSGSCVPAPHRRRLEARPDAVLRSRSSSPVAGRGKAGEQRPAEPLLDEARDVARGLEPVRQLGIRSAAPFTRFGVLHARGRPDHDHSVDLQLVAGGNVEGDTRAQGVSEQVASCTSELLSDDVCHETGRVREIGAHRVGSRVARQVQADERAVRLQLLAEAAPEPAGLGEPVEHHEGRARSAHLDVKWHEA